MVFTLSGHMKAEEVAELKALFDTAYRTIVLDLRFARGESKEMLVSKPIAFLAAIFLAWSVPIGHAQSPRRVEIIAKRFTCEPDTITPKKGQPVVLVLHSVDGNRAGERMV